MFHFVALGSRKMQRVSHERLGLIQLGFQIPEKQLWNAWPPTAVDQWSEEGWCNGSLLGLTKWASRCCVLSHRLSCQTLDSRISNETVTMWNSKGSGVGSLRWQPFCSSKPLVTSETGCVLQSTFQTVQNPEIKWSPCAEVFIKSWTLRRRPCLLQAKVVVGWDVMWVSVWTFPSAGSKWYIQHSEFMCSQLQTRTDLGSYLGTCFI